MSNLRVSGGPVRVKKGRPTTIFIGWAALFFVGAYAFTQVKANNRASGRRFLAEYQSGKMDSQDAEDQAAIIASVQAMRDQEESSEAPIVSIVRNIKKQMGNLRG